MDGVERAVQLGVGGNATARVLWFLGWQPIPLYVLFACMAALGWLLFRHPAGLVCGFAALFPYWKAVQAVNKSAREYLLQAESCAKEQGAARLGVKLDEAQCWVFSIGKGKPPFGVTSNPTYEIAVVYICEAFFAVYQPSILRLPHLEVQLSPQGEEFYFRHVSVVNYNPPYIQVILSNGKTAKQFPVGSVGNNPVLQLLRSRLRGGTATSATILPDDKAAPRSLPVATLTEPEGDSNPSATEPRHCYLRLSRLQQLLADPSVLDALLDQLQVPGEPSVLKRLTPQQKMECIETQIDHFRRTITSVWSEVPRLEVIAASLWRAHDSFDGAKSILSRKLVRRGWFCGVSEEADLQIPTAKWLKGEGYEPYMEVPLGLARVDVLGYKKTSLTGSGRLIAVELKNDYEQFKRALNQMGTFSEYADLVYMACTPDFAAAFLDHNEGSTNHWDASVLDRKLRSAGFGLLIVEREQVFEVIKPVERTPPSKNSSKVVDALSAVSLIEC
jgi:hypothetical protein